MGGQTQLLTPALDWDETHGSFANLYEQGNLEVSAPEKPWRES
jgi:hypothetical protein